MSTFEEYIEAASKDGSTRSGIVLGIRMALLALKELELEVPLKDHRSLVTIVETDRCLPDALQLVTGCRLGNRTLKFKDYGKMAATFADLNRDVAVRIAARESAYRRLLDNFSGVDGEAREEVLRQGYETLPEEELFTHQWVKVDLPAEQLPGYRGSRAICAGCGEGIGFSREVTRGGRQMCRACAGDSYFQPL